MTKWLLGLIGGLIALVLVTGVLLLAILKTSVGAGWTIERAIHMATGSEIEIRGDVDVDFLPMLTVRVSNLTVPADLSGVPQACLADMDVTQDPARLQAEKIEWVMDWQALLDGRLLLPTVQFHGLRVIDGLPENGQATDDQTAVGNMTTWLSARKPDWIPSKTGIQIDDLVMTGLVWQRCSDLEGIQTLVESRRVGVSVGLQTQSGDNDGPLLENASGKVQFVSDDLLIGTPVLGAGLTRWLTDSGYLDGDAFRVETLRGEWGLEAGLAKLTSFLLVGAGPNVELVSGEIDLASKTVSFLFDVDTQRSGTALTVPGVNIILRRSRLPVSITGDWEMPAVVVGQE